MELESELSSFQSSMAFSSYIQLGIFGLISWKEKHKSVEYQLFDSNEQGRSEVKAQADGKAGLRLGALKREARCEALYRSSTRAPSLLEPAGTLCKCRVTVSV